MGYFDVWRILGEKLLGGQEVRQIDLKGKTYKFHPNQIKFINNFEDKFCLYSGGFGCGKSLALYIKLIIMLLCFPGNRVLLGRKTLSDIERAILPDLFELLPGEIYDHRVKDAIINFKNGSQIILFGLDALQTGSEGDIKKAQQKIKSLNLGAYFIDQLEEIDRDVFFALNSRLRRNDVPFRQGNMTTNPANFWAYHMFKLGKKWDGENWVETDKNQTFLVEGSMLDNKDILPEDYIEEQMSMGERYVKRFVLGHWDTDVLTEKAVFAQEHVNKLQMRQKPYIATEEGCEIFEQPRSDTFYQMGIDPSEGVVDPSSISVVNAEGEKVAKWNGKIPIPALIEKAKFLYYKYKRPLIIPEVNAAGVALLEGIKDLKIYKRTVFEYKTKRNTEKLGFRTSHQSKQALIAHFQELLRKSFVTIYDAKTINEMKTFVYSDEARMQGAGAERNFHDDDVMSTLLAFWELSPKAAAKKFASKSRPIRRRTVKQYL